MTETGTERQGHDRNRYMAETGTERQGRDHKKRSGKKKVQTDKDVKETSTDERP